MKPTVPIRKPHPKPPVQEQSFWLTAQREWFTKQAAQHFAEVQDLTLGIALPMRTKWDE
jgi:hypothetical protein